ncbi:hypothetical protein PWT90_02196 [Aphanocladium album]|nr:hypothetical protein PWT90_02196 [Aphanocladium album]
MDSQDGTGMSPASPEPAGAWRVDNAIQSFDAAQQVDLQNEILPQSADDGRSRALEEADGDKKVQALSREPSMQFIRDRNGRREEEWMHGGSLVVQDPTQPQTPVTRLTTALKRGDGPAVHNLLENHFQDITQDSAQADYAWLVGFEELGQTRSEIAQILLDDARNSPWVLLDAPPQHDPTLVVDVQKHLPGCVHLMPWPSPDSESPQDFAENSQQFATSQQSHIQTLCGLAGITPSTTAQENWNGVVMFEDKTVASVTYTHEDVSRVVSRVKHILELFLNALHYAQSVNLCCQSFTILREETQRPDTAVVDLYRIEFSQVKAILDEAEDITMGENTTYTKASAAEAFLAGLFPGQTFSDSQTSDFLNDLQLYCLSAQILTVGFLSYIQSHAGPLHPDFLDTPVTKLKLFGAHSFSDQPSIEVSLRELTSLGDMLRSPVLVFGTAKSSTKLPVGQQPFTDSEAKYDVMASSEDIVDTWGPAQFLEPRNERINKTDDNEGSSRMTPSAIQICGGVIFAAKEASNSFHWSATASSEEFRHDILGLAARIRIGSSNHR